jgi:hypothetical protein
MGELIPAREDEDANNPMTAFFPHYVREKPWGKN